MLNYAIFSLAVPHTIINFPKRIWRVFCKGNILANRWYYRKALLKPEAFVLILQHKPGEDLPLSPTCCPMMQLHTLPLWFNSAPGNPRKDNRSMTLCIGSVPWWRQSAILTEWLQVTLTTKARQSMPLCFFFHQPCSSIPQFPGLKLGLPSLSPFCHYHSGHQSQSWHDAEVLSMVANSVSMLAGRSWTESRDGKVVSMG